jgi:CBS domain-containing protein
MAILLGVRREDILAWRGVAELVAEQRAMIDDMMSSMLIDDSLDVLKAFKARLDEEKEFESRFAEEFGSVLGQLEKARSDNDVLPLISRFTQLTRDYFLARGSVVAIHSFCNIYQDGLMRWALRRVEDMLELDEMIKPPAPYCWLVSGSAGRMEQTFCVDPVSVLIHGETPGNCRDYFEKFAYRTIALLGKIGLLPDDGAGAMMKSVWFGGRKEWRENMAGKLMPGESNWFVALLGHADLRLVHGDAALAEEMINVVRSLLEFNPARLRDATASPGAQSRTRAAVLSPAPALREVAKNIADISTGLDFFGRLKVEKSGRYRGKFNLDQYALTPLVTNIRMFAIECGLAETGTIDRIKGLQGTGRLSVELAERLLRAYHEFARFKVLNQIRLGCENVPVCYIDPRELSEDEDQRLRAGLESVSDLEKIAYLFFTDQG